MSPENEKSRDESLDANNVFQHVENRTITTRKKNEVPRTEENNLESSSVNGIAPADRKKKRKLRKVSVASQRRTRIQKGKKIQINKNHARNFLGPRLDVHCGKVKGVLLVQKMKKDVSEKCIEASDGTLFTLREFEVKGGRGSWKAWKRSIYYNESPLKKLIEDGKLPNPKRHWGKKKKTPSGPVHQSPQFQSSDTMTATVVPQESSWAAKQGRYQFRHAKKICSSDSASTPVVTCRDSLEQATSLTASESPSEGAEIVSQLLSGSTDTMTATEEPRERGRAPEKTASLSVGNLSSVPVPASCTPAATNSECLIQATPLMDASSQSLLIARSSDLQPRVILHRLPVAIIARASKKSLLEPAQKTLWPVCREAHWRSFLSNSLSLRTNIMNSLHKMMNGCRTLERKLQDVEGHMGRLEEEQKHLEQALNISNLQKRMNDIIHQQAELKTSLRRIVATLGLEEPQL